MQKLLILLLASVAADDHLLSLNPLYDIAKNLRGAGLLQAPEELLAACKNAMAVQFADEKMADSVLEYIGDNVKYVRKQVYTAGQRTLAVFEASVAQFQEVCSNHKGQMCKLGTEFRVPVGHSRMQLSQTFFGCLPSECVDIVRRVSQSPGSMNHISRYLSGSDNPNRIQDLQLALDCDQPGENKLLIPSTKCQNANQYSCPHHHEKESLFLLESAYKREGLKCVESMVSGRKTKETDESVEVHRIRYENACTESGGQMCKRRITAKDDPSNNFRFDIEHCFLEECANEKDQLVASSGDDALLEYLFSKQIEKSEWVCEDGASVLTVHYGHKKHHRSYFLHSFACVLLVVGCLAVCVMIRRRIRGTPTMEYTSQKMAPEVSKAEYVGLANQSPENSKV